MFLNDMIKERNMSIYYLSKISGIPYATVNDICNSKRNLLNCNAETIYKLSKSLNVSMESLVEPYLENRPSFELFKSNVCHQVKELGCVEFLIYALKQDDIRNYYHKKWYPECFYLLAMVDYISRIINIPTCKEYDDIRSYKLSNIIYPSSVIALSVALNDDSIKSKALESAIPEFFKYNIVESEIENVY